MPSEPQNRNEKAADEPEWLEVVRQKVASLQFGSVSITVHHGRVTVVESTEKARFAPKTKDEEGS
jgi:hypothetical protein